MIGYNCLLVVILNKSERSHTSNRGIQQISWQSRRRQTQFSSHWDKKQKATIDFLWTICCKFSPSSSIHGWDFISNTSPHKHRGNICLFLNTYEHWPLIYGTGDLSKATWARVCGKYRRFQVMIPRAKSMIKGQKACQDITIYKSTLKNITW